MASNGSKRTGYMFHELMMWHSPGEVHNTAVGLEPIQHFEHVDTKRRLNSLVHVSGLIDHLVPVRARPATVDELQLVHAPAHVAHVQALSKDSSKSSHKLGHEVSMAPGGYEIAAMAAGGGIALVDAVLDGQVSNGYALTRPPGHHATPDTAMGYCIFNNIAVAAKHALDVRGLQRVAIVDFDVHHGNGTQAAYYDDDRVLFVSLHQDSNYPIGSGPITDTGSGRGDGFTINVPLPPGSGSGAYRAAFDRVVVPALDAFKPQLILVSAGYDASPYDPIACQMVMSEDFRYFARVLRAAAERHCSGRVVAFHEGGYSPFHVPFCGLAVIEELAGFRTDVRDPVLSDHQNWGYQGLQKWQEALVGEVVKGPLAKLQAAVAERSTAAATAKAA